MELYCTRPGCRRPQNTCLDLDSEQTLKTVQQKFCITCGMPLILLGRYLPLRLLGQGGFGSAFLARDRYTPGLRPCVVKQLQTTNLNPQQLTTVKKLFQREGEVLEELGTHPQIPDLLAFFELQVPSSKSGQAEEYFYLVQEFIDGQTLEEELAIKGQFSEAEILQVLEEILPVLAFVHENGSIHRDIKPSNIMRRRSSAKTTQSHNRLLYLLDFGAVKQVAAVGGPTKATGIYTPYYAPPEQTHGEQVFPATDLYALSVTCISLLTGKEPSELYDAYSNQWNWRSQVHLTHPTLATVLDTCLQAAPSKRYASANAMLQALHQSTTPLPAPGPVPQKASVFPHPAQMATASTPATPGSLPPQSVGGAAPTRQRSLPVLLSKSGFVGFEAGLGAIALFSLLGTTLITTGSWLILLVLLMLIQTRAVLKPLYLGAIAAVTLLLVLFMPGLQGGISWLQIVAIALTLGLVAIAVTLLFQIVYRLLGGRSF